MFTRHGKRLRLILVVVPALTYCHQERPQSSVLFSVTNPDVLEPKVGCYDEIRQIP